MPKARDKRTVASPYYTSWLPLSSRLLEPAGPSCLFTCCLSTCRGPRWTACLPSPGWSTLVEAFCFHSLSQAGKYAATPRDGSPQCVLPGNLPADPREFSQPARDGRRLAWDRARELFFRHRHRLDHHRQGAGYQECLVLHLRHARTHVCLSFCGPDQEEACNLWICPPLHAVPGH